MPRLPRKKTSDAIFHIMSRSISEVDLFKDDSDRYEYISIIKKYQEMFKFEIYCYCFMSNHVHLIVDVNGADISSIMKSINLSYAIAFNKKYGRHGHLFQERFRSKIIHDEKYLVTASAYIHNNALDIPRFKNKPEEYLFSSLGIYIKKRKDPFGLVKEGFIMSLFGRNMKSSVQNYIRFVYKCDDEKFKEEIEFQNEGTEYRSGRTILVREFNTEQLLGFVALRFDVPKQAMLLKGNRGLVKARAIAVVFMRCLCNYKCCEIGGVLGNITQARISGLCNYGIQLIRENDEYANMLSDYINQYAA